MEKKMKSHGEWYFHWLKFLLMMKFTVFFLCVFILSAGASVKAQLQVVSLQVKDVSLEQALEQLKSQTKLEFFFSHKMVDVHKRVSVNLKNVPLEKALKEIFGEGYSYEYSEELVIIRPVPVHDEQKKIGEIKGKVVDEKGETMPGVTVLLKGTSVGVATDMNGEFRIMVPQLKDTVLIFSFIGMETREVRYQDSKKEFKMVMKAAIEEMDEVVVTGIFRKSTESYTGAVSVITEKELKSFGNRNLLTTLRNIDPSFNILTNNNMGSDPNHLPEVQIRGAASLPNIDQLQDDTKADLNTPLIIMDGFEITLQRMMDLDESEIAMITLLKDASATAIYGSRGANGVVVITTKEPEAGALRINYSGGLSFEIPDLSDYDVLNAAEKLQLELESGYFDAERADTDIQYKQMYNEYLKLIQGGVDTYWLSQPLRTGVGQKHNLRLEGGDKAFRYSVSLAYNKTEGIMIGSDRTNFNGGINLTYNHKKIIFRNKLEIGVNKAENSSYGSFSEYVKLNPYWTPYDEDGDVKKILDHRERSWGNKFPTNPMYNASLNVVNSNDYLNINNNFSIEWKPFSGFIGRGSFGLSHQQNNKDDFKPADHTMFSHYAEEDILRKGKYNYTTGKSMSYNLALTLSYSKTFMEKHMIYTGFNFEINQSKSSQYDFSVEGFVHEKLDFLSMALQYEKDGKPSGKEGTSRRVGFVGNMNYSYANRYFVDASIRSDGSSQFGADRRFAPFWSVGLGWNMHHEAFMQNQKLINRLKLRGSIGETGSNSFSPYEALSTYDYVLGDRYYQWLGASQAGLSNPNLAWQKTLKRDIGLEADLFNNRLSLAFDLYKETTKGLISSIELTPSSGFKSYKENVGSLENKGFEVRITCYPIRDTERQITWSVTGSVVSNRDKVIKLSEIMKQRLARQASIQVEDPGQIWEEGASQSAIYSVPSLGINPATGDEFFLSKDGSVTSEWRASDRVNCGNYQPKYRGNLNSMFRYKNFSLNVSFNYQWGGQVYNQTLLSRVENADKHYNVDKRVYYDRWKHMGDKTFFKGVNNMELTRHSSRFVQDESLFSCQNINFGYTLSGNKWLKHNLGLESIGVTGNIAEPFRFSTIKQERGIDYPFARNFSLSLSLMFK